jgi:hypothetical protein
MTKVASARLKSVHKALSLVYGAVLVLNLAVSLSPMRSGVQAHRLSLATMFVSVLYLLYTLFWAVRHAPRPVVSTPLRVPAVLALLAIAIGLVGMLFSLLAWGAPPAQHAAMLRFTRVLLFGSMGCAGLFLLSGLLYAGRFFFASRHQRSGA